MLTRSIANSFSSASDGITYVVGSTWLMAFVRRRDECDSRRGEPWGRQEVPLTRHQVLLASRKTQLLTLSCPLIVYVNFLGLRIRQCAIDRIRIGSKAWSLFKNYFYLMLHLCANGAKIQCFYFSHILPFWWRFENVLVQKAWIRLWH